MLLLLSTNLPESIDGYELIEGHVATERIEKIKKARIFPYCKGLLLTYAIKQPTNFAPILKRL